MLPEQRRAGSDRVASLAIVHEVQRVDELRVQMVDGPDVFAAREGIEESAVVDDDRGVDVEHL
jgi:hypothetical protein